MRSSIFSLHRKDLEYQDFEIVWLQLTCYIKTFLFVVFYGPPNASGYYYRPWRLLFKLFLLILQLFYVKILMLVIWIGTFDSYAASPNLCAIVNDFSFWQSVSQPTHDDSILDLLLCNYPDVICDVTVMDSLPGCDHEAIQFILKISHSSWTSSHCMLFNFNRAKLDVFCADLAAVPWNLT